MLASTEWIPRLNRRNRESITWFWELEFILNNFYDWTHLKMLWNLLNVLMDSDNLKKIDRKSIIHLQKPAKVLPPFYVWFVCSDSYQNCNIQVEWTWTCRQPFIFNLSFRIKASEINRFQLLFHFIQSIGIIMNKPHIVVEIRLL